MGFKAPRGTFDWLPEGAANRKYMEQVAVELFERYGYRFVVTPIFEPTELFVRSIGEATDIVQKEMYTFSDKADRSLTLRPEGTAPVVRAYLEHNLGVGTVPLKLYYSGPMFRYERPQAGRYRQFWQMGVEAIGSADAALDAEVIALMLHYFRTLGLTTLELYLNSMGCRRCRPEYVKSLQSYLEEARSSLCPDCDKRAVENPLRVFDCKNENCRKTVADAPEIKDYLCDECRSHFQAVMGYLETLGVDYVFSPALVRGFDYYTKTTFEVVSPLLGAQNALGGGGRYDDLVEEIGGPETPAIGFALGMERILAALEKGKVALPAEQGLDIFVVHLDDDDGNIKRAAIKLLGQLREAGIRADLDFGDRSLRAQMRQADRQRARLVLILGPDEWAAEKVTIREMASGEQEMVGVARIVEELRERFSASDERAGADGVARFPEQSVPRKANTKGPEAGP